MSREISVKLLTQQIVHIIVNPGETGHDVKIKLSQHPKLLGIDAKQMRLVFSNAQIECHHNLDLIFKNYKKDEHVHLILRLSSGPQSPFDSSLELVAYSPLLDIYYDFCITKQEKQCCYTGKGSEMNPLEVSADSRFVWKIRRGSYGPDEDSFSWHNIQLIDEKEQVVDSFLNIKKAKIDGNITVVELIPSSILNTGSYFLNINAPKRIEDCITTLPRNGSQPGPRFPGPMKQFIQVSCLLGPLGPPCIPCPPGGLALA